MKLIVNTTLVDAREPDREIRVSKHFIKQQKCARAYKALASLSKTTWIAGDVYIKNGH